ncbi:unnamed protein product [Calypogeia fissa]
MVVLFPGTKDQGWRWQTSNNDYGKFYLSLSREALGQKCRADGLHSECNRKCEQLARQLCELKSELDRLRVGSRCASPRDRDGCRDPPHHNGDCLFSERARMPCDDMFHTTHDIEYNGGRRTEPQVLEDHLRADHPRLVKKVPPLNPVAVSSFDGVPEQGRGAQGGGAQGGGAPQSERGPRFGRGKVSKYWTHGGGGNVQIHSAPGTANSDGMNMYRNGGGSAGSGGYGGGGEPTVPGVNEYQGGDSGGPASPRGAGAKINYPVARKPLTPRFPHGKGGTDAGGSGGGRNDGSREKILPPSQRYNFYRYYGFAGQGAKTSRGWNPK